MTSQSPRIIGLICKTARDGSSHPLGDRTALACTRDRLAQIRGIASTIVIGTESVWTQRARVGRAWSPTGWRGGIGGMTIFDEFIDPQACAKAIADAEADAAYLVGADWPLVDPQLSAQVIERFIEREDHQMVFTQAPPGICGMVLSRAILDEMARHGAGVCHLLDYHPATPRPDPTGRDGCVQIEGVIRSAAVRATTAPSRWAGLVEEVYANGGRDDIPAALSKMTHTLAERGHAWPQQVTLELTPRRSTRGAAVPTSQVEISRPDMTQAMFDAALAELAKIDDVAITLGGIGDALLHGEAMAWLKQIKDAMPHATVCVQTDLLIERDRLDELLSAGLDVLQVRLNADTPPRYERLMGVDGFGRVTDHLKAIWEHLRSQQTGLPLIVPSMIKCRQNVEEMESFYDRWLRTFGSALIEPPATGAGLLEDLGVVDMSPPRRVACRQLRSRMMILSDGIVPRCDQDWLARDPVGHIDSDSIADMWQKLQAVCGEHERGEYGGVCAGCKSWYRP